MGRFRPRSPLSREDCLNSGHESISYLEYKKPTAAHLEIPRSQFRSTPPVIPTEIGSLAPGPHSFGQGRQAPQPPQLRELRWQSRSRALEKKFWRLVSLPAEN